jgi:prephenate dehydrogenase
VSTARARLAVIGAGLMGGSIALAARRSGGLEVRLTDADAAVRARARALDLAEVIPATLAETVEGADLVIAAVPTSAVAEVLLAAARLAPPDAILTDAASLKGTLTLEVTSRLRDEGLRPERFVGGHPMAGSERSGPDAADGQLFQAATWVLTPTAETDDGVLTALSSELRGFGARVVALAPDRHDELVAVISHLPQVVASTLAAVAGDVVAATGDAVLSVAGGGFRDTTRIAASDPALWIPILQGNRAAVLEALAAYRARLVALGAAIEEDDWDTVAETLRHASAARHRLAPKVVTGELADVVVPMDDRPGQLAAATTALGSAGINVEDLTMRHAGAGGRGALVVRVAVEDQESAVRVLEGAGLHAHLHPDSVTDDPAPPPNP